MRESFDRIGYAQPSGEESRERSYLRGKQTVQEESTAQDTVEFLESSGLELRRSVEQHREGEGSSFTRRILQRQIEERTE